MTTDEKAVQEDTETKYYELGYLIVPVIPEEKVADEESSLRKVIEKYAEIVSARSPEQINLAYEMIRNTGGKNQRFDKAYFGSIIMAVISQEGSTHPIESLKADLKKNTNLLRTIILERSKESLAHERRRTQKGVQRTEEQESAIDRAVDELVAE